MTPAGPPARAGWPFHHAERIRFGDLDAMRHLNNVEFLRFFETARIAFMQSVFPDHDPAAPTGDFGLIFAEAHIAYRSPGRFGEVVRTWIRPGSIAPALRSKYGRRPTAQQIRIGHASNHFA